MRAHVPFGRKPGGGHAMIAIVGKTLGRSRPLFADFSISPPPECDTGDDIPLRALIERIVRDQVRQFHERQAQRRFLRALTEREIAAAAERGKVESGGSEIEPQAVDPDAAVAAAWQAFEDGIYLVAIDEAQARALDEPVRLTPDSRVTFIRLTLLAGG
jgi:hypothetical protein